MGNRYPCRALVLPILSSSSCYFVSPRSLARSRLGHEPFKQTAFVTTALQAFHARYLHPIFYLVHPSLHFPQEKKREKESPLRMRHTSILTAVLTAYYASIALAATVPILNTSAPSSPPLVLNNLNLSTA